MGDKLKENLEKCNKCRSFYTGALHDTTEQHLILLCGMYNNAEQVQAAEWSRSPCDEHFYPDKGGFYMGHNSSLFFLKTYAFTNLHN